jgi:hypothetical protein
MKHLLTLVVFAITSSLFAQSKPFEGVLNYKITERNAAGDIVVNSESSGDIFMHVKGNKILMQIIQINVYDMGIDTMNMYYLQDFDTKQSFIGMKMIDNLYCTEEELDVFPAGEFNPLKIKTKSIQGLVCNAADVVTTTSEGDELSPAVKQTTRVWYTQAYTAPNIFFGQFQKVPGLIASVEENADNGNKTVIELVSYTPKSIREDELQIPKQYKRVTWEELLELYPILDETMQD